MRRKKKKLKARANEDQWRKIGRSQHHWPRIKFRLMRSEKKDGKERWNHFNTKVNLIFSFVSHFTHFVSFYFHFYSPVVQLNDWIDPKNTSHLLRRFSTSLTRRPKMSSNGKETTEGIVERHTKKTLALKSKQAKQKPLAHIKVWEKPNKVKKNWKVEEEVAKANSKAFSQR